MIIKNLYLILALASYISSCTSGITRADLGTYSGGPTVASSDPLEVFYDYYYPHEKFHGQQFVGKLGHHVNIFPSAYCSDGWRYSKAKIVRGKLPPGLKFDHGNVVGIPSHPGVWELAIKFAGLSCGAVTHPDKSTGLKIIIDGFPAESI